MIRNTQWTDQEVLRLYNEYTSGKTLKELSKQYSTDAGYLFKTRNLLCRTPGETRALLRTGKKQLNWQGEQVTTEQEAYILGIWYADGWVGEKQAGLRLHATDKKLLEALRDYFNPALNLYGEQTNSWKLILSSTTLCQNFMALGCVQAKTHKPYGLPPLSKHLIPHFIRGFFDGDGTVFHCSGGMKANICGINLPFLLEIQSVLAKSGIESKLNIEKREGKHMKVPQGFTITTCKNMGRLFIRKKMELLKFYQYLYNDATIFMERKEEKFLAGLDLTLMKKKPNSVL